MRLTGSVEQQHEFYAHDYPQQQPFSAQVISFFAWVYPSVLTQREASPVETWESPVDCTFFVFFQFSAKEKGK